MNISWVILSFISSLFENIHVLIWLIFPKKHSTYHLVHIVYDFRWRCIERGLFIKINFLEIVLNLFTLLNNPTVPNYVLSSSCFAPPTNRHEWISGHFFAYSTVHRSWMKQTRFLLASSSYLLILQNYIYILTACWPSATSTTSKVWSISAKGSCPRTSSWTTRSTSWRRLTRSGPSTWRAAPSRSLQPITDRFRKLRNGKTSSSQIQNCLVSFLNWSFKQFVFVISNWTKQPFKSNGYSYLKYLGKV